MKRKIHCFYTTFYDREGKAVLIGGIQNYLIGLSKALQLKCYDVIIYQPADKDFSIERDSYTVVGITTSKKQTPAKQIEKVYKKVRDKISKDEILIWGTDKISLKTNHTRSLSIQHGISFDYIPYFDLKLQNIWKTKYFGILYKIAQASKAIKEHRSVKNVVLVDYNYQNWIRTVLPRNLIGNTYVIPNYAEVVKDENIALKNTSIIKILFARRFEEMRGVSIMIEVVKQIQKLFDHVHFTICGEGSMKKNIVEELKDYKNVHVTSFNVGDSQQINLEHHISIIPTYGSEGTSFSLLEGMAAGAVPVASNVGGMTNIIINDFNGYLVNPTANDFINVLSDLINNPEKLKRISMNAKSTVEEGFSYDIWSKRWHQVINEIEKL
jgi:glycosyltransferase involved in cell wall biosynthesis